MICGPDLRTAFRPYDTTCEYSGFRNMVYLPRAPRSPLPCHKLSEEPLEARGGKAGPSFPNLRRPGLDHPPWWFESGWSEPRRAPC